MLCEPFSPCRTSQARGDARAHDPAAPYANLRNAARDGLSPLYTLDGPRRWIVAPGTDRSAAHGEPGVVCPAPALVAATIALGLRLLRGATALAFGLASLVALVLFRLPLGLYTEKLHGQAGDMRIFMIP
jgi:hypothetical protein